MGAWNAADLTGLLFLGYGVLDGYRKGFVKKGTSLVITLVTLLVVYISSPYVETFLRGILPEALSLENLVGTDNDIYRVLILSGFGEQAENYVQSFAARVLSLVLTYAVVKLFLRTVVLSLEILVKVPGLSLANRLLGALLGLIQQLVVVWLFFLFVMVFSGTGWGKALYQMIQDGFWIGFLYDNNLLLLLGIVLILGI